MFSYYGSKSKIVDYYPKPIYNTIIEPFAGSAKYALKHYHKEVILYEKSKYVFDVWIYLQNASKNDILKLPILKMGESLDDFDISNEEKQFMSFVINDGAVGGNKKVSRFALPDQISELKQTANNLHKIKHWKIYNDTFENCHNIEATWFIDPPYQFGGEHYKESSKKINFKELANWCKSRQGQVMVCENTKAEWLKFNPLVEISGTAKKSTEAIWTNYHTHYNNIQLQLI